MKKVSIIIPCYNSAKTLKKCLDSIINQTYKNIEIILVDDFSIDNTVEIIKDYAKSNSNIKFFLSDKKGVSNARNLGLKEATGDYIQFVDSDDFFLHLDVIEILVKCIEENRVDMVVFNFIHPCFESHLKSGVYNLNKEKDFKEYYQDFFACSLPWNRLMKKELIKANFNSLVSFAEDELFNLANVNNVNKLYYIAEPLYYYFCDYNNTKSPSAINRIYKEDRFWEKENTIWYGSVQNLKYRNEIFEKNKIKYVNDICYIRLFDFFLFDFAFMNLLGVEEKWQNIQCEKIVKNKIFLQTLYDYEKHGLILKSKNIDDVAKLMKNFVQYGVLLYKFLKSNQNRLRLYIALYTLFAKIFFDIGKNIDKYNLLASCLIDIEKDFKNIESICVKYFLDKKL